ncbi:NYN domain-containing protein [Candidatus Kuenenbacteria bacterium]|nr:NYN domain-containing protein [Candidatus Kuenenbacteria bacterium]
MGKDFKLKLNGNTLVCIDWANVYGWQKKLKWKIDAYKLIEYFKNYPEVRKIKFYFGTDINQESKNFVNSIKQLENEIFKFITKDVKYVLLEIVDDNTENFLKNKKRRKCDFDIEIALDTFLNINNINSFVLVSGDGDYEPLVKFCIEKGKQVIIVANPGSLGKEYKSISKGLFVCNIKRIKDSVVK